MSAADWQQRYAELAERLPELATRARPVLCGLGACVDVYVRLEEALRVLGDAPETPAGALRELLLERARRGIGGEIRVDWPGGPAWLDQRLPRRHGLGGTGAQVAQTLAVLGAPALLALSDRSAAQLALIHPEVRVAGPDGIVPVPMVESAGRSKSPHYIVEFTAGVPAGDVVPPRSSRVIVRFDDDPLEADPWFTTASGDVAAFAGAAILSGFNGLPAGALPEVLAWVRPLARSWRAAGLRWVHLELGDFANPADMDEVLDGLAGSASTLGLSQSELAKLVPDGSSVVDRVQSLAERYAFDRVAVHADRFALALTRGDPERELQALMTGALVAATRACHGRIAVPQACPPGAAFTEPPEPSISRRGACHLACCPTPYLPRPAATIGLGDSFLAGTLLILSQPSEQPSSIPSRGGAHGMTTLTTKAAAGPALDPGKARSLQRVTSPDGFFLICALDHLSDFQQLLAPDPATVDYAKTVEAKLELIRVLAPEVSAFLLDARFGLAQAILSRALPGRIGPMASIEDEDYRHAPGARRTRLREHWGTKQIKLIGADVCKLLWFYRPDAPTAAYQRGVVEQLVAECRDLSLPLVVEPIWYALDGEDTASSAWQRRRVDGIIESAHVPAQLGVDMLKVEFAGDVGSEEGRHAAAEACARLDAGVEVPWVILSAGVGYDDFKRQVEIAAAAGSSGFLAGRSIWRDAVSIHDPERRHLAATQAAGRLAELAAITRAVGRPFRPALEGKDLVAAVAEDWYVDWHRQAQ